MPPASTLFDTTDAENSERVWSRNRPIAVSEAIKQWIAKNGLQPGDRLPQESELIKTLHVSKGTVREALKALETQGLIRTRTGPGGGAFITRGPESRARALLANHFFFRELSISDIYEMRRALEPELAAELALSMTEADIAVLEDKMTVYDHEPVSGEEEWQQRIAELEFHARLAEKSSNPLLSFTCGFLVSLLQDLTVCRKIYERPNPELREQGLFYQQRLIDAFRARNADMARDIMREHMNFAQKVMEHQEAEVKREFLKFSEDAS